MKQKFENKLNLKKSPGRHPAVDVNVVFSRLRAEDLDVKGKQGASQSNVRLTDAFTY